MLSRRDPVQSIIRVFSYLGKGCIVILAAVAIITSGLAVSATSSAPSVVSPADRIIVMASLALTLLLVAAAWSVAVPNVIRAEH
jgi:hypothetical protein